MAKADLNMDVNVILNAFRPGDKVLIGMVSDNIEGLQNLRTGLMEHFPGVDFFIIGGSSWAMVAPVTDQMETKDVERVDAYLDSVRSEMKEKMSKPTDPPETIYHG